MTEEQLQELDTILRDLGYAFFYRKETGSTNDWALEEYRTGRNTPAFFLTDRQVKGKGRLGRTWTAREGASLTFSVRIPPECGPELLPSYTLVFGLGVCRAVRKLFCCEAQIKWPNDIVCGGKKICGILTEAPGDRGCVVIGTGINLKKDAYPEELAYKASSLQECSSLTPDPSLLIRCILEEFEKNRTVFLQSGSLSNLKDSYTSLLVNIGRKTIIQEKGKSIPGEAVGIDDFGRLIFEKPDGERIYVESGEASVEGIY